MSFGNTLEVTTLDELILYLNASDIIINDFNYKDIEFYIALRPWINIHPASEFRCIVINKILRGKRIVYIKSCLISFCRYHTS